ncbi:hypothetical protein RFI_15640 [Reticulomyxa filosa]|uniref:Uncharacterized protein n=1 Tax=Reticulomyxa filosa TaxID=46433 RepID=X6N6I7_RETFI|nr:hypothetical protein RFI_15640 [Reticulomyxa filosa]|eukprot:ETO21558.1 hypothetical protein RFI_15640 [Reticulomyxa filosa]
MDDPFTQVSRFGKIIPIIPIKFCKRFQKKKKKKKLPNEVWRQDEVSSCYLLVSCGEGTERYRGYMLSPTAWTRIQCNDLFEYGLAIGGCQYNFAFFTGADILLTCEDLLPIGQRNRQGQHVEYLHTDVAHFGNASFLNQSIDIMDRLLHRGVHIADINIANVVSLPQSRDNFSANKENNCLCVEDSYGIIDIEVEDEEDMFETKRIEMKKRNELTYATIHAQLGPFEVILMPLPKKHWPTAICPQAPFFLKKKRKSEGKLLALSSYLHDKLNKQVEVDGPRETLKEEEKEEKELQYRETNQSLGLIPLIVHKINYSAPGFLNPFVISTMYENCENKEEFELWLEKTIKIYCNFLKHVPTSTKLATDFLDFCSEVFVNMQRQLNENFNNFSELKSKLENKVSKAYERMLINMEIPWIQGHFDRERRNSVSLTMIPSIDYFDVLKPGQTNELYTYGRQEEKVQMIPRFGLVPLIFNMDFSTSNKLKDYYPKTEILLLHREDFRKIVSLAYSSSQVFTKVRYPNYIVPFTLFVREQGKFSFCTVNKTNTMILKSLKNFKLIIQVKNFQASPTSAVTILYITYTYTYMYVCSIRIVNNMKIL